MKLETEWNLVVLNLTELTKEAFGTEYAETLKVQVNANCRLRRIFFSDMPYTNEQLPEDYKLKTLA
jgi:hypothetical protein